MADIPATGESQAVGYLGVGSAPAVKFRLPRHGEVFDTILRRPTCTIKDYCVVIEKIGQ